MAAEDVHELLPRWHPAHEGRARTADRVGDFLATRLWRLAALPGAQNRLRMQREAVVEALGAYEREPRALVRLAHTGRLVTQVGRAHEWLDTFASASGAPESESLAREWPRQLEQEREDRVQFFRALVADEDALRAEIRLGARPQRHARATDRTGKQLVVPSGEKQREMRDAGAMERQYCVELLTLLKYDHDNHADVLLPNELSLVTAVFERLACRAHAVVVSVPSWFVSPLEVANGEWRGTRVSVDRAAADESEEAFVRQAARWMELNHPHIAKLYGACHVRPRVYVRREEGVLSPGLMGVRQPTWDAIYQCALGMQYLHERGLAFRQFSRWQILSRQSFWQTKVVLHAAGVVPSASVPGDGATDESTSARTPSPAADLRALAEVALAFVQRRRRNARAQLMPLEPTQAFFSGIRPEFLSEPEWAVLADMYLVDTEKPPPMVSILQQLEKLKGATDESKATNPRVDPSRLLCDTDVPTLGCSFSEAFDKLTVVYDGDDSSNRKADLHIYKRLAAVYRQVRGEPCGALSTELMGQLGGILARFYRSTIRRTSDSSYSSCFSSSLSTGSRAAQTIADRNYSLHRDIDRLLALPDTVITAASVHDWKRHEGELYQHQLSSSSRSNEHSDDSWVADAVEAGTPDAEKSGVLDDSTMSEWSSYEVKPKARGDDQELGQQPSSQPSPMTTVALPSWFIPSYEVDLGAFISEGSFGTVYRGTWSNASVVVKTLLNNGTKQRLAFIREAEIWFMLNHPNVIQLYGACHIGPRPFFVCELADKGALSSFLATRYGRSRAWSCLYQAASGLEYLHDRGIVHGDLKGNNILVSDDNDAKLTDFGLSRFERAEDEDGADESAGALGAYRWKAPECLTGSPPSFASDVYSFAMCIIEAVSGEYPWGNEIPDAAVKFYVKRGDRPARSSRFRDDEWELVTRMCAQDPRHRVTMSVVVQNLLSFRWRPRREA